MALRGNYSVLCRTPGRYFSGGLIANTRSNFNTSGANRGLYSSERYLKTSSIPGGYVPPYSWVIPQVGGGMATGTNILGVGAISSGNLAGGLNAEAPLSGSGDITNAALGLILSAVATLSGSGNLSGDILGILEAAATLAGSGDVTGSLGALASAIAALSGTGDITSASVEALASISADINVTGDLLTTANVGASVWNALAAAFNNPGTMGELLNAAGGGSSPEIIADIILRRTTANVEASANGDALSLKSLYGMISQGVHNTQVSGATLTVTQSDDTTVLGTRTVTTNSNAQPITGIDTD